MFSYSKSITRPMLSPPNVFCLHYFQQMQVHTKPSSISKTCCTCLREKTTNLSNMSHKIIEMGALHLVFKLLQHSRYWHVGSMAKPNFPFFAYVTWKRFGRKNNDNPRECFFDVWCYSGSHGELLFSRCACALVVFYISIVFDNDGQLRMMNTWMMAENEFERLDDTTSSFTIIKLYYDRCTYHMIHLSLLQMRIGKKGSTVFKCRVL